MNLFQKPIKKFKVNDYIEMDNDTNMDMYGERIVYKILQIEYGVKINEIDLKLKTIYSNNNGIKLVIWRSSEDLKLANYKILKSGKLLFEKKI